MRPQAIPPGPKNQNSLAECDKGPDAKPASSQNQTLDASCSFNNPGSGKGAPFQEPPGIPRPCPRLRAGPSSSGMAGSPDCSTGLGGTRSDGSATPRGKFQKCHSSSASQGAARHSRSGWPVQEMAGAVSVICAACHSTDTSVLHVQALGIPRCPRPLHPSLPRGQWPQGPSRAMPASRRSCHPEPMPSQSLPCAWGCTGCRREGGSLHRFLT